LLQAGVRKTQRSTTRVKGDLFFILQKYTSS
jgi:hypothetical protein